MQFEPGPLSSSALSKCLPHKDLCKEYAVSQVDHTGNQGRGITSLKYWAAIAKPCHKNNSKQAEVLREGPVERKAMPHLRPDPSTFGERRVS